MTSAISDRSVIRRGVKRALRIFILFVLTGSLTAVLPCGSAYACSCEQASDAQIYRGSSAVFIGTATGVKTGDPAIWTFDVESVDKGEVGETATVALPAYVPPCGFNFTRGERYQVFSYDVDGQLTTDNCVNNRRLKVMKAYDPEDPSTDSRPSPVVPSPASPPPAPASPVPTVEPTPGRTAPGPRPAPPATQPPKEHASEAEELAAERNDDGSSNSPVLWAVAAVAAVLAGWTLMGVLARRRSGSAR